MLKTASAQRKMYLSWIGGLTAGELATIHNIDTSTACELIQAGRVINKNLAAKETDHENQL